MTNPTGKESIKADDTDQKESGSEFLTFYLADEVYGIDILRVREIRGWEKVTRIPNAPSHVKGVLNLRGSIVPIYDLRVRFNLSSQEPSKDTVVIVLRVRQGDLDRSMGVIVDAVSDVLTTQPTDISGTPDFGARLLTEAICGLASTEGNMVMLLDVDKLLFNKTAKEEPAKVT